MLALSRTCNLADFPDCLTVADWQQCLAEHAWRTWASGANGDATTAQVVVVNVCGIHFAPPGPAVAYCGPEERPRVPASVVYALCVLDHIPAPGKFLGHMSEMLLPLGMLFLTFSYWDAEGPDTASGHRERRRIYSAHSYTKLIRDARRLGFENFGGTDWTYYGDYLDDHSLASLVLRRRQAEQLTLPLEA